MDKNNENYLKIRQAFYQQDMSKEKRYVDKMCDLYFNEKIPFNEIVHLFRVYEENREIPDATGVGFNKSNYEKLSSFIYKITGEYLSRWKMPNVVYNENGITISLIKNYEEAKNVPCFNTWCVFNNKDYWMTHKQDGDTIYLMRLVKDFHSTFYSVRVEKNGQRHYYAYDHTELSNVSGKYPSFDDIEQTIGTNGIKTLIPRMINESKTHKNMNKKVIKINESQLREMIAESVKNVLKEELGVAPKMNFRQTASIKAKNLLYDYKELLNIVQGMAETSSDCEDVLGKIKAGYDGLYSLANWGK